MLVKIKQGMLQGEKEGAVMVFRGIPYAEPPVGSLRFAPPRPVKEWKDVLFAQNFGPRALQPFEADTANTNIVYSEDCLTLNVWTPQIDNKKRKVVVWIHGGGFVVGSGSNPKTSGRAFAEKEELVFVSINYRLGAFGFLHLGDLLGDAYATSGNCGLLDIMEALRWVKENIHAFGGDADCVTLMGQSAGAKCIAALLIAPKAKGLFHRVILESGAMQSIRDKETAQETTLSLLKELGLRREEAHKLLEVPAETILEAEIKLNLGIRGPYLFGPVVDGLTLPQPPERMLEHRNVNRVPVLIGTNKEEAKSFSFTRSHPGSSKEEVLHTLFGENGTPVSKAYHAACTHKPEGEAWTEILTEYLYGMASRRLAASLAGLGIPVWMYRFDFQGTSGALHGAEMAFVWNDATTRSIPATGEELAGKMHAAWITFIQIGNPQTPELPLWTPCTENECNTMLFDKNCCVVPMNVHDDRDFPLQMLIIDKKL